MTLDETGFYVLIKAASEHSRKPRQSLGLREPWKNTAMRTGDGRIFSTPAGLLPGILAFVHYVCEPLTPFSNWLYDTMAQMCA